jgi:hypothetical protein
MKDWLTAVTSHVTSLAMLPIGKCWQICVACGLFHFENAYPFFIFRFFFH